MKEGKIIEINNAEELYLNPKHPYTKSLLDAIPGKNKKPRGN